MRGQVLGFVGLGRMIAVINVSSGRTTASTDADFTAIHQYLEEWISTGAHTDRHLRH